MTPKALSLILGCCTILLWGSIATFGRLLMHMPPFFLLGFSFLVGGLLGVGKPREIFQGLRPFLWGTIGFFSYHFFLFYAFRFAPAIEANLINYLWPILMVFMTPVFFPEEKLRWFHYAGAGVAITGCVFLVAGKGEGLNLHYVKGYSLAFLAALSWPIYSLGKKRMPPTSVWAISGFCLGAAVLCFATHAWLEPRVHLIFPDVVKLLMMGIGPFGLAFFFWDKALQIGNPKVLGALAYLTPVISTLGLLLFTDEVLSENGVVAIILIIGGATLGLLDFLPTKKKIETI